jgi:hypothetical protein
LILRVIGCIDGDRNCKIEAVHTPVAGAVAVCINVQARSG